MLGFVPEDHWSRNECPVKFSECPTGSDDTKTGIGIERKKIEPRFTCIGVISFLNGVYLSGS